MHKKPLVSVLIPFESRNAALIRYLDSFTKQRALMDDMYHLHGHELLEVKPVDVILDVGCAAGHFSEALAQKSKWTIGIDIRAEALLEAKRKGLDVLMASATFLPFKNNTFNKVSLLEVIEHLKPSEEFTCLQEIHRVLEERGSLVFSTPNKGKLCKYIFLDPAYCITRHKHFSVREVEDILTNAGFKIKELYTSGGFIYVLAFYSLFWRLEAYGLLRFWPLMKSIDLLRKVSVIEFSVQKKDGCTVIACAQKK